LNVNDGNGSAVAGGPPLPAGVSNTFGIGLVGTSKDNLIEENRIGGNINGVYIGSATQGGNVIRRNVIAGNPPVQVSKTFGANVGADIQEVSFLGGNAFEENLCLTYAGHTVPAPCPSVPKQDDVEARRVGDVSAKKGTIQAQRANVSLDVVEHPRVEALLAGAIGVLIVGLAVPKRRYRNLSGKK
jgi:hypothetical protein